MKFTVLALGAAVASITCVLPCSAQLNIEAAKPSQPENRLAFQSSETEFDIFGQTPAASASIAGNDPFAPGATGEGFRDPRSILSEQASKFTSASQNVTPEAISGPAPAQGGLDALANTPEVGMVPVCWPDGMGTCRTPNPIADIMMRNWCTDGLWATYAAERACQCAHIQQHTGGFNRYTNGCGACAQVYASSPVMAGPMIASPVTASPVTASPVTASPVTASPVTASPVTANKVIAAGADPLAGIPELPRRPLAQLVISPAMSAPAHLPAAQVAPNQAATPTSAAPHQAAPAQSQQPPVEQYRTTPSPLPADPLPTVVPIVASRSAGYLR